MNKEITLAVTVLVLLAGCVSTEYDATSTTTAIAEKTTTTSQINTTSAKTTGSLTTTSTTEETTSTTEKSMELEVSIETDKDLYHSNEQINITVTVKSVKEIGGSALRVYGLKKSSFYFLDTKENIDIKSGVNTYSYEMKTPRCNVCSGIKAGTYNINAEITYLGEVVGKGTKKVEIRQ